MPKKNRKQRLLKSKRYEKDMTQERLAKQLGLCGAASYSYIENHAEEYFKLDVLRKLCRTLNIDIAEFVKEDV